MATALATIAVRSNKPTRLEGAIDCMRSAAEVYREGHVTQSLLEAENRIAKMEAELAKMKQRAQSGQTNKRH